MANANPIVSHPRPEPAPKRKHNNPRDLREKTKRKGHTETKTTKRYAKLDTAGLVDVLRPW